MFRGSTLLPWDSHVNYDSNEPQHVLVEASQAQAQSPHSLGPSNPKPFPCVAFIEI